jgi:hydrogenase maturation protease
LTTRTAIIGIGNVLTGDDGVGPYVVRVLQARYAFPEGVSCEDLGTPGYELTTFFADAEAVVLVDSVRAKGQPGEIRVFDKAEILKKAPIRALSPHEPGVREALLNAEFHEVSPKVFKLVGVIPESVETNAPLSPAVRAAVPMACAAVIRELEALGIRPVERNPPEEPDIWWEKPRLP